MIYLILYIVGILAPSFLLFKRVTEWVIYFFFFFFWEFGLLRIILFKKFNLTDNDLHYLEKLIIPVKIESPQFITLLIQVMILNLVLIIFIKKLSSLLYNLKTECLSSSYHINKHKLRFSYISILLLSIYIIRNSLFQIITGSITGYQAITNFQGSGYYVHVFLNRVSLLLFLIELVNSRKKSWFLFLGILSYSFYFLLLGQRNELFSFFIAVFIYLSIGLSLKRTKKLIVSGLLGLWILRTIEIYRSGEYDDIGPTLFIDSISTLLAPLFGAESIVPFYSHYASLFIEHNSSLLFYLLWFIQSFGLINFNMQPTYVLYKSNFFAFEDRGMAINLFGSLNVLENWILATIYLPLIFFLLRRYIAFIIDYSGKYIPNIFTLAVLVYAIPSIILLGRNGLEGLRPLLYHNLGLYFIILYFFKKFLLRKLKQS